MTRRMTLKAFAALAMVCIAFSINADVTKSSIAAKELSIAAKTNPFPDLYTECDALLTTTNRSIDVAVNTGIFCPEEGDIWIECDYVFYAEGYLPAYFKIAGIQPVSGNSMGCDAYRGWNQVTFRKGMWSQIFSCNAGVNMSSVPSSIGFGIIGDKNVLYANGKTYTADLIEGERTYGTFYFGLATNTYDDNIGQLLGKARIYLSGQLVWDGIPCTRNRDNKAGYYDLVSEKFFPCGRGMEGYNVGE